MLKSPSREARRQLNDINCSRGIIILTLFENFLLFANKTCISSADWNGEIPETWLSSWLFWCDMSKSGSGDSTKMHQLMHILVISSWTHLLWFMACIRFEVICDWLLTRPFFSTEPNDRWDVSESSWPGVLALKLGEQCTRSDISRSARRHWI